MSSIDRADPRGSVRPRQALDAATYAVAVAATVTAIGVVTAGGYALAVGGAVWVAVKTFLFVAGFGILSYALLRLWPARPTDDEADIDRPVDDATPRESDPEDDDRGPGVLTVLLPGSSVSEADTSPGATERDRGEPVGRDETRFQRAVQSVPPLRWYPIVPADRLSPPAKLLLGGLLVLALSFAMETLLGVGPAG